MSGTITRMLSAAFLAGGAVGAVAALVVHSATIEASAAPRPAGDELAALKAAFRRPAAVPFPADNPYSENKRALGEALFNDVRLSIDNSRSCASCHDRAKGFADGKAQGTGVPGRPLKRHTPTLWNLAWAVPVFWDGRARSLEEQVAGPIESPDEMAQPVDSVIARLSADPAMERAFAEAFPQSPKVDAGNLAKAIATFERTFVSPETRFDRFVAGADGALSEREIAGFRLFTGKAGCSNCHSGFALTDQAFYDIGLPGDDRGRGAVLRLPAAEHAFKTPGLREIGRSAPYMHDGSLATLEDVIRHYQNGIVERPTLARDLPRALVLTDAERADLLAFLGTLTSESDPALPSRITAGKSGPTVRAERVSTVSQDDRTFHPKRVSLRRGERLWIVNNDSRTHNVRIFNPALDFDSGAQEPGETVQISFPKTGSFLVFCGIHPKMELYVDVGR
ncbi:MAG: cytochrome c peroxidase [Alphaproteobacteria bacterium]|jgi:cytochrome c peroxidase|nr:cytochrome c peroxidase [Alphaproteobacteria bacterium]